MTPRFDPTSPPTARSPVTLPPSTRQFMMVPLSEHYPCTRADLLRETAFKIGQTIPRAQIDKIVTEFDRCSHILGAVSLYTNMPIAGAKWFPGPESQGTAFSMEYYKGNEGYLQGQIGNPDGEDKPNKKYYDPRKWLREGELSMVERLKGAFEDLNCIDRN